MDSRRRPRLLAWVGCALLGACTAKPPKHYVERAEVSGATLADNALLGMTPPEVEALLVQDLKHDPAFVILADGQSPPGEKPPVRIGLELAFTREAQKEGRAGTYAEVGATLELKRRAQDVWTHYEVVGLGEEKIAGDSPAQRKSAVRAALQSAVLQAVASADLQLAALDKSDRQLVKDLSATDGRVREFAVRVLAERKNPAAADALIEKLKSQDPDEIRRAMGGLVELRERKAVPALIDLARGKDYGFLREIIFALGEIGGDDAEAYLYTVAQGHDQAAIRDAAKQALDELSTREHKTDHDARSEKGAAKREGDTP